MGLTSFGFNSGGGGGDASEIIYEGQSPSTIAVGGTSVGYVLLGKSIQQIMQDTYCPYVIPTFASFYNNISSPQEVGTTLSGNYNFYYSFNTAGDVQDGSISVLDVTASTTLATGLTIAQGLGVAVNVGTVTNSTSTSHQWRGTALDTASGAINPANFSIFWYWREWWGTNANPTLSASDIQALANSNVVSAFAGQYTLAAGNYKYFVWDDSLGSPTAGSGFKDNSTGFAIAMATVADNAFYSNVQNGWYYGLVAVTQNGVTSNKRVYRSLNILSGSITINVS